jgi:hypothetical protein
MNNEDKACAACVRDFYGAIGANANASASASASASANA